MSVKRQIERASQRQQMALIEETVRTIDAENTQLKMENKSLYRAIGALVAVAGGEMRLPRDMDELLKGKNLTTEVDDEYDEIVFRITEVINATEQP